MVKVSEKIREAFKAQRVIPMATVNGDGVPNVIYVGVWWWEDNEILCVVNNYLNKTLANVRENGRVCFVCHGNGSYQIKCVAEEATGGPLYEKARELATNRDRPLPGKSAIVCTIKEIYQSSGGKGAGDRIA
jgi:predicted pyridoxine 5'-phosphate oxidase superfamily flavin-nucleotide-binding protein